MKRSKMTALIVAAALAVAGCAVAATAFALGGRFDARNARTVTHTVSEPFTSMEAYAGETDIILRRSDTDECTAVCQEDDRLTYTLTVDGDTLILREVNGLRWYDQIGLFIGNRSVILYLPAGEYDRLSVKTRSGSITAGDEGLTFADTVLKSESGRITFSGSDSTALWAKSASGAISVSRFSADSVTVGATSGTVSVSELTADTVSVRTSSGGIRLTDVRARAMSTESSSGHTKLAHTAATATLTAQTTSGGISLTACDATDLMLSATSGSITGSLTSGKEFDAHSHSGDVRCPPSVAGNGTCKAVTHSGRIRLTVDR